jgi:hypothetical protein
MQHERAQGFGELRAAGLTGADDLGTATAQHGREAIDMTRFSGAVDAFKGDEPAAHTLPICAGID